MNTHKYTSVDEYFAHLPKEHIDKLLELREALKATLPEAEEVISYNMPAYKFNKVLIYFSLAKKHLGYYPTPSPIIAFKEDLKHFKTSKGAVQFPLDKPFPIELICTIAKFRLEEEKQKL